MLNNTEKYGKPRMLKISSTLQSMLYNLPKRTGEIFPGSLHVFRRTFRKYRKRLAQKLNNPQLNKISFHTIRHWKATMEYHRTKDILYVKELLGHQDIKTILIYTQLINFENDNYHVKVSKSLEED